ncbi:MAG: amylo-alpha-1,6-glucosidase [Leptolyngbyaceae cyanobacterium]
MAIQFGRAFCGQLALAESREWLVTNGLGSYACGTVADVLTRHYHGLLLAALQPPLDRTLLLTKLDATVTYGEATYPLQCDRWAPDMVTGHGYRQLERFVLEGTVPTWHYALADALLVKRVWMEQGANTTYIRYTLKRGTGPLQLSLKALVNYRNHHHSTHSANWQMSITPVAGGLHIAPYATAQSFGIYSDRGIWTPHHTWYQGYDLAVERYRGIEPSDDHLHAGTVMVTLAPGDSITLAASTEPPAKLQFTNALKRQRHHEQKLLGQWYSARYLMAQQAPAWLEQLVLAAHQFIVARPVAGEPQGKTIIAGYPWFGDWGRDTMIALPGLAIATGQPETARPLLRTFAQYVDQGLLPNVFPEAGARPDYNTVDASLWYFEAIRLYHSVSHDCLLIDELFPVLADMIRWHQKGTRYHIHLDTDGLIAAGETGAQLTWMDAKVGDWVVTPRHGKPVEINALWYNALLTMAHFADLLGASGQSYRDMAAHTRQGFQRYWSDALGYCHDVLDGPQGNDPTLRPNQLLAVAFPADKYCRPGIGFQARQTAPLGPPLFTQAQQKAIVDTVAQQLMTSYGVRSLAPNHPDYHGHYGGSPVQRDGAYHQGPVWGWLIGPFIQAHLQVYQDPAIASTFLTPFADHLRDGCVGTLSEIFDGNAPHTPRGAFAQAWSVAEVLRSWSLIENLATCQKYASANPEASSGLQAP